MLDRYAQKDRELRTLGVGDIVLTVIKEDPKYPARGVGVVKAIDWEKESVTIEIEEEFRGTLEDEQESITGIIRRPFAEIDKPMEIYYEQIARRVGTALAEPETDVAQREKYAGLFTEQLKKLNVIPAGPGFVRCGQRHAGHLLQLLRHAVCRGFPRRHCGTSQGSHGNHVARRWRRHQWIDVAA